MRNRNLTSKWIVVHYLQKFIIDPNYSLTFFQQDVMIDFMVHVSLTKCFKAKQRALEVVFGNHKEQYSKIYEYFNELRQTNVDTTTIFFLECKVFKGMHVCMFTSYERWV